MSESPFDVTVVGGGVTGTAIFYVLAEYTDIESVALIERREEVAAVNSNHKNNSHTLHYGDIETNYSKEKAATVKKHAELVENYVENNEDDLFNKTKKMVLGVGEAEIATLEQRYEEFQDLFPKLKKADRSELAQIEPNVVKDRPDDEPIMALVSPKGYAINYKRLAESFVEKAGKTETRTETYLGVAAHEIVTEDDGYTVMTDEENISSKAVVIAAGAHSLYFAHLLGYGEHMTVLPTQGDYYCGKELLTNKVYRVQIDKLPFAAVHGDPSVTDPSETRFGPTARVMPLLERRNLGSVFDFFKVFSPTPSTIGTLFSILSDPDILSFVLTNFLYDIPYVGKHVFLQNIRDIIPSLDASDIHHGTGIGGLRPQIIDTETYDLMNGEVKITDDDIIFNMTPSPGASVCLGNAEKDVGHLIAEAFEDKTFDEERFAADLKHEA